MGSTEQKNTYYLALYRKFLVYLGIEHCLSIKNAIPNSALKIKEILPFRITWMNMGNIILDEIS